MDAIAEQFASAAEVDGQPQKASRRSAVAAQPGEIDFAHIVHGHAREHADVQFDRMARLDVAAESRDVGHGVRLGHRRIKHSQRLVGFNLLDEQDVRIELRNDGRSLGGLLLRHVDRATGAVVESVGEILDVVGAEPDLLQSGRGIGLVREHGLRILERGFTGIGVSLRTADPGCDSDHDCDSEIIFSIHLRTPIRTTLYLSCPGMHEGRNLYLERPYGSMNWPRIQNPDRRLPSGLLSVP